MSTTTQGFTLRQYLAFCQQSKKWFFISVALCMAAALGYLMLKKPVYERSTQLMVREDATPSSKLTAGLSMIQGLGGMLGGSANVNNELLALTTPYNIVEAIKRLHLDDTYTEGNLFHRTTLYGSSLPIRIDVRGLTPEDKLQMEIKIAQGNIELSHIKRNKTSFDGTFRGQVNGIVHTPIGLVAILPTGVYTGKESQTITFRHTPPVEVADAMTKKLDAGIAEELGSVIDLRYEDVLPQRAEDFLRMLVAVYNERWMGDENQLNASTTRFIDNRIAEITTELGKSETTITAYKTKHNLPDVVETTKLAMETSTKMSSELATLRGLRAAASEMERFLNQHANANQTLPVNLLNNDKTLAMQVENYNQLQLERNRVAANSNASNSIVQGMDKQLAALRSSIHASLRTNMQQIDQQIATYYQLKGTNDAQTKSSPQQAKFLLSAERQQKIQEQLYIFMLQKREENILSRAFTPYKVRVLSPPMGSLKPVKPHKLMVLGLALLMGCCIPLFVIFLRMNVQMLLHDEAQS